MFYRAFIILMISLLITAGTLAQQWIRIYGGTLNTEVYSLFEHYDHGYLLSGKQLQYYLYGFVIKTNVNGYMQWSRSYGAPSKYVNYFSSRPTMAGGFIENGMTNMLQSNCLDPVIVKINSCGEKEWCKIYDAPGCNAGGMDIETIQNCDYIALMNGWKSGNQEKIWLFRLDSLGEVIWSQVYATNPALSSEISYSLTKTSDSCVVVTGEAYYPDPTCPGKSIIKVILIKVKLDGTAVFEVPWGTNNGVYSDGRLSIVDTKNNIYTSGRRARTTAPGGDSPCVFKTSKNGAPVLYKDLKTTSSLGEATTINWFQDSTMVLCAGWLGAGTDTTAVIKTDSNGNFINQKTLLLNKDDIIRASDITYNNRIIVGGPVFNDTTLNWETYAFKLTSDLEYDSVYTRPFTYDSLCPHPIVSDTVPLDDCEVVIVGLDDAQQHPENPCNTTRAGRSSNSVKCPNTWSCKTGTSLSPHHLVPLGTKHAIS